MKSRRKKILSAGIVATFLFALTTWAKTPEMIIAQPVEEEILTLNENDIIIGLESYPVSDAVLAEHNQIVDALITNVLENELKLEYILEDSSDETKITGHIIADNAKEYKVGDHISTKLRIYEVNKPDNTIETNYVLGE